MLASMICSAAEGLLVSRYNTWLSTALSLAHFHFGLAPYRPWNIFASFVAFHWNHLFVLSSICVSNFFGRSSLSSVIYPAAAG